MPKPGPNMFLKYFKGLLSYIPPISATFEVENSHLQTNEIYLISQIKEINHCTDIWSFKSCVYNEALQITPTYIYWIRSMRLQ